MNRNPWLIATSQDSRIIGAQGVSTSPASRWLRLYMDRVMALAVAEPEVYRTFLEVCHLLKPPSVLFAPRILLQVFKQIGSLRQYSPVRDEKKGVMVKSSR